MPFSFHVLPQSHWPAWLRPLGLGLWMALCTLALGEITVLPSMAPVAACSAVMGMGLALRLTQGRSASVAIAVALGVWHWRVGWWSVVAWGVHVAGTALGVWLLAQRLRLSFLSTSHPFARQATWLMFLREAAGVAAPWAASALVLAHAATQALAHLGTGPVFPQSSWSVWLTFWMQAWLSACCGMLLFTPLTWEWRVSLVRSGRRRWWPKLGESLRSDHRVLTGVGLLVVLATGLPLWGAPELAAVAAVLVWPLSAWYLVRSTALGGHVLIAWAGSLLLLWATHGSNERLWPGLWVMPGAAVLGLLLVTAHERRLALQRLERHADTDALTSLLSLNGLYRLWDEWADSTAEEGHISPHAPPTLVSVHMSNVDAMEQLLGAHHSDLIERATAGALANTAPKVQWARIAKAHFVGWMGQEVSEGTLRALMGVLRVAAVESNTLHDENTSGHPLWVVAALRVEADPLPPPIEVVMACLRHAEQAAQDSREGVIHRVNQASAHALKLEAEQAEHIRQIIQRQQLVLYAQPIVANQHPEAMPHKYEILVRLHDAQGNCVPPSRFLPVAMRAGLMQWLDMAVMEQTFAWFAAHPQALAQLNHCAINLSGPTVANPVVAQRIQQGLQQHQLPPEKFTFEITESQAIANPAQATETIRAIRSCGCRVAIDDFGTGVATFDYLKRFDVDYIKIDGAFIQSLLNDPVDRVIVESIVKVAHQLQVRTVAEFVATADLHTAVTALGVDESQGFAFGAPRPLHEWFHAS